MLSFRWVLSAVVYVIDAGLHKQKGHDAYTGLSSLSTQWVSKAAAKQRAGRAGRVRPGICYHLYSSLRHQGMPDYDTPEIKHASHGARRTRYIRQRTRHRI